MAAGDVYRFVSEKVTKNKPKPKYHICIALNQGLFLYINSSPYEGSMKITQNDWPEMPKEESHISCNAVVRYSQSELRKTKITLAGKLSPDCLKRLYQHIDASLSMPEQDIDDVVIALSTHVE